MCLLVSLSHCMQDIDCMPSNPVENMPTSMKRTSVTEVENLNIFKINGHAKDQRPEGYIEFSPTDNLENVNSVPHISPASYPTFNLLKPSKVSIYKFSKNNVFRSCFL